MFSILIPTLGLDEYVEFVIENVTKPNTYLFFPNGINENTDIDALMVKCQGGCNGTTLFYYETFCKHNVCISCIVFNMLLFTINAKKQTNQCKIFVPPCPAWKNKDCNCHESERYKDIFRSIYNVKDVGPEKDSLQSYTDLIRVLVMSIGDINSSNDLIF